MENNSSVKTITESPALAKPIAIYCRVSTDNQENEGTSLDTQRQACLKYCQDRNYQATHQIIETWSGLSLERPKLDELRQLVRNEEISGIVIYCLDRLSRDPTHGVILQEELEKHHVSLEAVIETVESTDLGKLISYIRNYASKLEAEKIRERTMRGTKARVFDKKLPVTYRQPFGYSWDKENRRLVPNNDHDTAKLIINLAIEGKSYDFIIAELKNRGILSPAGLPEWNKHTISTIIRNPVYAGRYHAFKSEMALPKKRNGLTHGKSSVKRLPQDQWHYMPEIEVVAPPMALDQRALLLDQLQRRQHLASRNAKREYLLRGMIFCETHKGQKGEPRRYHGIPKYGGYYYCCPVGGCVLPYLPGPKIEAWAKGYVARILLHPWWRPTEEDKEEIRESIEKELRNLYLQHSKVLGTETKLEERFFNDQVDPEVYQRLKAKFATEKQWVKDRQAELLDNLAHLNYEAEAMRSIEKLRQKFVGSPGDRFRDKLWKGLPGLTNSDWRQLFATLDLHIRVGEFMDELGLGKPNCYVRPEIGIPIPERDALRETVHDIVLGNLEPG